MRGIILAAGKGSRLNGTIGDKPKCLLRVGGKTLVERQIEALEAVGITDIAVVIGCQADSVRRTCGPRITYIENSRYAQTNSLYSLWLARPLLYDGFVVMNCDVLFHPQMLSDLVTSHHDDALLIAYQDDDAQPFGDEEMKVRVRRGRVAEIAKTMSPDAADGENVGIVKFGRQGARTLVGLLDRARCRRQPARLGAASLRRVRPHPPVTHRRHTRFPVDRNRLSRGLRARGARDPSRDRGRCDRL